MYFAGNLGGRRFVFSPCMHTGVYIMINYYSGKYNMNITTPRSLCTMPLLLCISIQTGSFGFIIDPLSALDPNVILLNTDKLAANGLKKIPNMQI